ncbi:NYN domain-containing protein [Lapillicoccus sp.]|uniref:NYN domain-containing protein n=1 Tax=Lapillicoccus sp. TaxID=1909287 RepID=UPI00344FB50B
MRSHCAIYVDVGYLLASAATRVTGTSLRSAVVISYPDLVTRLIAQAETLSGLPALRVHWYDAGTRGSGGPSQEQNAIGMLPRVKLRLGRTSPNGEQKGVDLRIGLDLASHGRGRVVDVIYLVSGDDDLTEAVEEAQSHGVQVVVLAVPDANGRPYAVSSHLIRESDGIVTIDSTIIDETVHVRQRAEEPLPATVPVSVAAGEQQPDAGPVLARPDVPTPADLARPKPRVPALASHHPVMPAAPAPSGPAAGRTLVYSSSSGGDSGYRTGLTAAERDLIDEVCHGVVATWAATATAADRAGLLSEKPYIPSDLDRTLLTDLSARLGVYDINDEARGDLRESFWDAVAEAFPRGHA